MGRETFPYTALQPPEAVLRPSPPEQTVPIGSSLGTVNMAINVLSTMTRPRRDRAEAVPVPENEKARAKAKKRGKTEVDPPAQGDLMAAVRPEGDRESVPLVVVGALLPPTGNLFGVPPRAAKRIARYAHSI